MQFCNSHIYQDTVINIGRNHRQPKLWELWQIGKNYIFTIIINMNEINVPLLYLLFFVVYNGDFSFPDQRTIDRAKVRLFPSC